MDRRRRTLGLIRPEAITGKGNDVQLCLPASFVVVLSAAILAAEASAQTLEQFYAGKTIDFVIGYPPGGSNDTFGRLLARHLGKHIPGKPAMLRQLRSRPTKRRRSSRVSTTARRFPSLL